MRQYADFNGRARRKEFWTFYFTNALLMMAYALLSLLIVFSTKVDVLVFPLMAVFFLYYVATIIPMLAAIVRRLHDTGNSGWMYFVTFVPLIGGIWLLVLLCQSGTYGDNQYGEDPIQYERY